MPKRPTTGVRLESWQREELEKLAKQNGDLEVSDMIRWAVVALIKHAKRFDGRLLLPLDFDETAVLMGYQLDLPLQPNEPVENNSAKTIFVDIPLFGTVPAGSPTDNPQLAESFVQVPVGKYPLDAFALRVRGDSMIGKNINDGDTVIVQKREARHGDVVVALTEEGNTLKTLVIRKGKYKLRSENPKHKDPVLTDQSAIQGVMIGKL
jgi:SOS-response transcriptional repressor LexA